MLAAATHEAQQRRAGLAAIALWEKQHGRFTLEEMKRAAALARSSECRERSGARMN